MPFPFSSQGIIFFENADLQEALVAVEGILRKAEAGNISKSESQLDFTGGLFRAVSNWNLLIAISSGSIVFRKTEGGVEATYRISFLQMFLFVTALVGLAFSISPKEPIYIFGVMWLWLFGMNYLITIIRFPSSLRAALNDRTGA